MKKKINKYGVEIGDVLYIEDMQDEPEYCGRTGEVIFIDDIGQIHGTWGCCALIPETDSFRIIENNNNK